MQVIDISKLNAEEVKELIGNSDENLKYLEEVYKTDIVIRDNEIKFLSDDEKLFENFSRHIDRIIANRDFSFDAVKQSYKDKDCFFLDKILGYTFNGKPIRPRTLNQYKLSDSIRNSELVFAIGPAGTGKTYIAILEAVKAYKEGQVKRIILTRPAVEAGESLGFLPGDFMEKIDPYLMPLYDSLYDIMGQEATDKLVEKGVIEVLPLAYMRGRTLNEAFIILDESQNTTKSQMLMFLTRLGKDSKMVVNGDITQIDLNMSKNTSGLVVAKEKLSKVKKINFIEFNNNDIVRHPLVQTIIENFR